MHCTSLDMVHVRWSFKKEDKMVPKWIKSALINFLKKKVLIFWNALTVLLSLVVLVEGKKLLYPSMIYLYREKLPNYYVERFFWRVLAVA